MRDVGVLIVRLVLGGLMAGHGAQKLFGWFGGHGLRGTAGWLESLGLRPGGGWAAVAGAAEFGGGVLTALGLLHPLGPLAVLASMVMAAAKAHWGKPIWVTSGGAELPLINGAIALGLMLAGPGRFSADHALGLRLPKPVIALAVLATAAGVAAGLVAQPAAPAEPSRAAPPESRDGSGRQADASATVAP